MKRITAKTFALVVLMFSVVFGLLSIVAAPTTPVYALPNGSENIDDPLTQENNPVDNTISEDTPADTPEEDDLDAPDDTAEEDIDPEEETASSDEPTPVETQTCSEQTGKLSWIVCPTTEVVASAIDSIYGLIGDLLVVQPLSMDDASPIYIIWRYVLNLTNIVFVIFLLIVIMSQITGVGISNYGVKRALPKLIIAVILMNLSFLLCTLAVDVSNIVGSSLREFFHTMKDNMLAAVGDTMNLPSIGFDTLITAIVGGTAIGGLAISALGGFGTLFWMLVPVLIGAVVAVVTGLLTIAARQALVALLVMAAPLACAAYLLPNTEKWFTQWRDLLVRMLVFYPLFSFLYGASELVGWALIASAENGYGVVLGLAVQVFPLFFSWSLMKMSGTVLGTLNEAFRKVARPAEAVGSRWAMEHAEQKRQNYIGQHESAGGARFRRWLDYRRTLRLNDTKNAAEIRQDRAIDRAMRTSASVLGRDEQGNMQWTIKPNRYARTAKSASYHHTLAANANAMYQNTLSGYGRHFTDAQSARISYDHAEAFADSMAQQFLAANEAEADQQWLLNQYLSAKNNLKHNSYQYNRLIKDAAGGLGHNGESSIMGQVIIGNSNIENRRRSEARVMITKFGMEKHKQQLRGMVFDKQYINDDGFATDERRELIEDDQYNLLPGKRYIPWQNYIAVHKVTEAEITKEQYDALSEGEKAQYTKVRYFDITNDKNDDVQRVFEDDAGYMKEILADDIAIADPINKRYLSEIGLAKHPGERDGVIRRYHSTIRTALDSTSFKDHAAGVTAMLTSSANAGNLRGVGHYNVGILQSLAVAAKPGSFLKNDKFFIEDIDKLVQAYYDDEKFKHYFPDEVVNTAVDNNGIPIKGMEVLVDENGDKYWHTVNYQDVAEIEQTDPERALELRKNFLKHNYMARAFSSVVGFLNREMTPDSLASLKPGALPALKTLLESLRQLNLKSLHPDTEFEDRINVDRENGPVNLFATPDGHDLRLGVQTAQDELERLYGIVSNPQQQARRKEAAKRQHRQSTDGSGLPAIDDLLERLAREQAYRKRNDFDRVSQMVEDAFVNAHDNRSLSGLIADLTSYFSEVETLRDDSIYSQFENIIQRYQSMPHAGSTSSAIGQITDPYEAYEKDMIEALKPEIIALINQAYFQE